MSVERNMLGTYGPWASGLLGEAPGVLSFRNERWHETEAWREEARGRLAGMLHSPSGIRAAEARTHERFEHDGLEIEALSWQFPYGPRTGAYFLKPRGARGRLPGVLALHDHGGIKYFGKRKIVRAGARIHPLIEEHQLTYYGGVGWANEIARRGFAVLVHDVFPFETRRILAEDLPPHVVERMMRPPEEIRELTPQDLARETGSERYEVPGAEPRDRIVSYNAFAAAHESIVAKSLFSAGLTWPGITLAEDRAALDYLAERPEVDPHRLGCGGLSGGGLRTVFLAGMDDRIRCAVCAGFMSTWRDFLLSVSYTHTWMIYVPGLPGLMDFPEILGMRAPLPSLVLATTEDPLFSFPETEKAFRILQETYRKAGAPERLRVSAVPGPHRFDLPMQGEAFAWMERWLS